MARNSPEAICTIKHKPNNDPKFHIDLRLEGEGKKTKELEIILTNGCLLVTRFITNVLG
jgi:hypothetical protein